MMSTTDVMARGMRNGTKMCAFPIQLSKSSSKGQGVRQIMSVRSTFSTLMKAMLD